jgi:predicted acylesterase/phospholipase RssA
MRTQYFSNCWGVFEGGGVRAAAFAGAYRAATDLGISFSRVAGTSAGALTAALVAAGAAPDFVDKHLVNKDFSSFLIPSDTAGTPFRTRYSLLDKLRSVTSGRLWFGLTLLNYGGLYSSRHVEEWIEALLKELLAPAVPAVKNRPVRFDDLPVPLHLLATDVLHGRPKLWSRETTPGASVSFAVRCSCSIPFFFQPVQSNGDLCVDGGMLSNLPSFVFAGDQPQGAGRFSARILAFQLVESGQAETPGFDGLQEFAVVLANTVVSGSTDIQMLLQSNIYRVPIDTGTVKSTDFANLNSEQKGQLFKSGSDAVTKFVAQENAAVYAMHPSTTYAGFDQKMLLYVQSLSDCNRDFWISDVSSYWFYSIFPAIFDAIQRGIRIHFVTSEPDPADMKHEVYRRGVLQRLGVDIHIISRLPFNGFIRDPETDLAVVAMSSERGVVNKHTYDIEQVRAYSNSKDRAVVRSFWNLLQAAVAQVPGKKFVAGKLLLRSCDENELFRRLSNVSQYENAKFRLDTIDVVETLGVVQNHVKEYKYLQIDGMVRAFQSSGIELFFPQQIVFGDDTSSIVTPPVLETIGDSLVVIEGHTRAFYCLRNGIRKIKAVVVDGAGPLPGSLKRLSHLTLSSKTINVDGQVEDINWDYWRNIEEEVHPIE